VKVFKFGVGLAVGYVLGSRAGREKYEQIVAAARKAQSHPTVTKVQEEAKARLSTGTGRHSTDTDPALPDAQATLASGDPVSRSPRRRPKTTPTTPAVTTDPLT
jgi:hypothetical protein